MQKIKKILISGFLVTSIININAATVEDAEKAMNDYQKPLVNKVKETLEKDPQLSKEFDSYNREVKLIDRKLNPKEQEQKIRAVNERYRLTFEKAFKIAKIDLKARLEFAKNLEKKLSDKNKKIIIFPLDFLTYAVQVKEAAPTENPAPAPTPPQSISLEKTFEFKFFQGDQSDVGYADLDSGVFGILIGTVLFAHIKNKSGLGSFFTMPWPNERLVKTKAKYKGVEVYLSATSTGGGSGAKAFLNLEILNNNQVICQNPMTLGSVIAPIFWHATFNSEDSYNLECSSRNLINNTEYKVRATVSNDVSAGGLAAASAFVDAQVDKIDLSLEQ